MSTIMKNCDDNQYLYDKRLLVKGASEIVLTACTHYINENGERKELLDN